MQADPQQVIISYIAREILDGEDMGDLTPSTPLLELGILNSMELVKLVAYIEVTFGLTVPGDALVASNFHSVQAISQFITGLENAAERAARGVASERQEAIHG